ncbi:MAG: PASTA domain-containing protein, partial [Actinomycetes bacterium]
PNVVAVHDQGSDDGVVFLTMELVEGRTLRDVLVDRGRPTPGEAIEVMQPVLAALGAAHRAGLVHRDVKPENVLLADDGRVKVADFGLARAAASGGTNTNATVGLLIGTVGYVAPEQVERGASDARSDVYAAGILLFELLTGHKPYEGDNPMNVAFRHVHEDVPAPSELVDGLPEELDDLVLDATDRDPAGRPADANLFLARLVAAARRLDDDVLSGAALHERDDIAERTVVLPRPRPLASGATAAVPSGDSGRTSGRGDDDTDDNADEDTGDTGDGGEDGRRRRRPGRRSGLIALLLVLLLAAGLSGAAWFYGSGPGAYLTTPSVLNLSKSAAAAKLTQAGLQIRYGTPQWSETVARDHVIGSDPRPQQPVRKGGTVTLVLSKGPHRTEVPKLVGLSQSAAEAALARANLVRGKITARYDDSAPKGQVLEQSVQPQTPVKLDSSVDLVISKGLPPVDVPDVRGQSLSDATAALEAAGLRAKVGDRQFSDTIDKDAVISQAPTGGTLTKGSTVTLTVSKGPDLVTVPNLRGKRVEDAQKILQDLGLEANIVRAPFGPGRVFDQSRSGQVKRGSTVTLYVV